MDKVRVSVIGATGYAGVELVRILAPHPMVEIAGITSDSYEGKSIQEVFPHLRPLGHRLPPRLLGHQAEEAVTGADVVFTSLPHGHAMGLARKVVGEGKYLIDLGADFRLKDPGSYRTWYGLEHACPDLLEGAVYGLPEARRDEIRRLGEKATRVKAVTGRAAPRDLSDPRDPYGPYDPGDSGDAPTKPGKSGRSTGAEPGGSRPGGIVANPGCYPTSVILALAPLMRLRLAPKRGVIVDSKSGVSGAGRGLSLKTHFCEVNENISAYSVSGAHRHIPEMEQELSALAGESVTISFTPHLCPMIRGILSTIYVPVDAPDSTASEFERSLFEVYRDFYLDAPFVDVLAPGRSGEARGGDAENLPETKDVLGSNVCRIGLKFDSRTSTLVIVSVIDNLVKGAAGQAVQNMNILMGFPETEGLLPLPAYP